MTDFPYEYRGGGWFREKGVPKGQVGEMLHGDHVVEEMEAMIGAFVLTLCAGFAFDARQQAEADALSAPD